MFSSKSKSIMTTKGMSLLARGSKGNWELLASILVVGKRIPKHSDFVLVFGNPLSYYSDFDQYSQLPLEPLANSDIPLAVIIDLLSLKNITKSEIHS